MTLYLDNAATSWPKPPVVGSAAATFLRRPAGNPGRAGHAAAAAADRLLANVRRQVAALFGLTEARQVVFGCNGTDCLNMAIHGVLGDPLAGGMARRTRKSKSRPHVVTSHYDHNSVQRPLNALATAGAIQLTRIGRKGEPIWRTADVLAAVRPDTALVALTHASNVTGAVGDIAAVATGLARQTGRGGRPRPMLLIDGAQTAGCLPVDLSELPIDLFAAPGHKGLLGPTGTGVLLLATNLPLLQPWREGGTGLNSTAALQPEELPTRMEAGTANTFGLAGLSAALSYLEKKTVPAIAHHEAGLRRRLIARLNKVSGVRLHAAEAEWKAVGVLSLDFLGAPAVSDAAAILQSEYGIATRSGLHCAPYAHTQLGTMPEGTLRLSVGPFTTAAEIDQAARAIADIAGAFRRRKGRERKP